MILKKKNIVLLWLLVVFVQLTNAQPDTIPNNYFTTFQKNIEQLSSESFFADETFYPGKFRWEKVPDFTAKYESLNPTVFTALLPKAEEYFQFFTSLPEGQKKSLVQSFSFYEKAFESVLGKAGVPLELKYLAPAVSSLNSTALGNEKRAGVWQLTHFQAVLNGGDATRLVDERLDVLRSTQMAAQQLKENKEVFNTTDLAVLAFLAGNTAVKNAFYFSGNDASINVILNQLPKYISDEVAAFQAMSVFLATNRFMPELEAFQKKKYQDTVLVYRQLHFKQIEKVIGIPLAELQRLNPEYKYSIIPENKSGEKLVLPEGKKDDFVLWHDSINNALDSSYFQLLTQKIEYPPAPNRQYVGEPVKNLQIEGKTKIQYRLKTGDVLGVIAETFDVRVADLKYWNNIYNERKIQAGQKINIFVSDEDAEYYKELAGQTSTQETKKKEDVVAKFQNTVALKVYDEFDTDKKIEHVVKSGESPFIIAKQYDGVTPDLILQWNHIDDARKIQIGQKLIIYQKK